MNHSESLRMTVYASLLAALTAVGAIIAIPIPGVPVPIVLQNMFIFLSGLLLGGKWGLASVSVYLFAGALGLPVFAGGTGGIGKFAGPTGGYLIGYLPAVFVIGLIAEIPKHTQVSSEKTTRFFSYQTFFDVIGMLCGTVIIYACGVTGLKLVTGMTWGKSLAVGMYPFLLGDGLKIAAAAAIAKVLRPHMDKI